MVDCRYLADTCRASFPDNGNRRQEEEEEGEMDYLKYYLPVLMQVVAATGLVLGGGYVWLGIATLPALAIVDSMLPLDLATRKIRNRDIANIPVWIATLFGPVLYLLMAWSIGRHGDELSGMQMAGIVLSCGWLSVLPLV